MGVRSIKLPDVGEGVAEAEIVEWPVKVGDLVKEDQVVAAVMTDKATVEMPTPVAGSVLALGGAVGDVLAVGAELIRIEAPGMPDSPAPAAPKSRPTGKEAAQTPSVGRHPSPLPRNREPRPRPARRRRMTLKRRRRRRPRRGSSGREAARVARGAPEGPRSRGRPASRARLGAGPTRHPRRSRRLYRPRRRGAVQGGGRAPNTAVETIKVVGMRRRIAQNWPSPRAASRISPMSRKPTSPRSRNCALRSTPARPRRGRN